MPAAASHHERIDDPVFRRAVDLLDAGDAEGLRAWLLEHPNLIRQRVAFEGNYFQNPALLEFIAENPIRHGRLPPNIVAVARTILEAGAKADRESLDETLMLVCSGRVARECDVQTALIDLLCDYGAHPGVAMAPALTHAEFNAVDALLRRGASVDLLVASATGQVDAALRLLPDADPTARHRAFALAAQHGHAAVAGVLLDAGESPDRYNPNGFHGHSTPLHQAALAGHLGVVRLLVERGARLDIHDTVFDGTPLGWANHGGRTAVAEYLVAKGAQD